MNSFARGYCEVPAIPGDIVVTATAAPCLDENMYQCVKSQTAAEATAGEGARSSSVPNAPTARAATVPCGPARDCTDAASLMDEILAVPQDETAPDQWEVQIQARILMHHPVIYVTRPEMRATVEEMKMAWRPRFAVSTRRAPLPAPTLVTVVPNGISVIVRA